MTTHKSHFKIENLIDLIYNRSKEINNAKWCSIKRIEIDSFVYISLILVKTSRQADDDIDHTMGIETSGDNAEILSVVNFIQNAILALFSLVSL